ncbi:hypothetical protein MTO96_017748 [Rhipicephalus appendiculatus]
MRLHEEDNDLEDDGEGGDGQRTYAPSGGSGGSGGSRSGGDTKTTPEQQPPTTPQITAAPPVMPTSAASPPGPIISTPSISPPPPIKPSTTTAQPPPTSAPSASMSTPNGTTTLPPSSVICTVDGQGPMEVPADGVCDFIFYDSLGHPFDRLGRAARGPFKIFQTLAANGKMTQFGVSIFPLDIPSFLTLLNTPTSIAWSKEKLWNHNIYHWGILNEISKPSPTKRVASYTFLGYYGNASAACMEAVRHMEANHRPSVLIILGHLAFKEQDIENEVPGYKCLIMPPSLHVVPKHLPIKPVYAHSVVDAVRTLECVKNKLQPPWPVFGVSMTLKGRWYIPKVDDSNITGAGEYNVFKPCESFQEFGSPQLICNETGTNYLKHLHYDDSNYWSFTYDKKPGRKQTFTFDDGESIKRKGCVIILNFGHDNLTLAAYDVNYDYAPSLCPKKLPGSYHRLERIKQLIQYEFSSMPRHPTNCFGLYSDLRRRT